jgi:hypothetical protein
MNAVSGNFNILKVYEGKKWHQLRTKSNWNLILCSAVIAAQVA